jgi:hypothetical protein
MAVTQTHYQPAQPAKTSNKGVWIISGVLAAGLVIAVVLLIIAAYNEKGSSTDSKTYDSTPVPGGNKPNVTLPGKPDNSVVSSSPPSTDAQIDETLDHYIEALGGREAIENVTSRVAKGTLEISDLEVGTVEFYAKAPDKYMYVMRMAGGVIRSGYNGTVGWAQEANELRKLEGAELAAMKRDAEFYREINLKQLFPNMSFDGKNSVNGRDVYVLTAIPPEGGSEKWYFDAKTGLLIRNDSERESLQGLADIESSFEQYKVVDGINLPVRLRQSNGVIDVVIKIKEINHNVTINDSIFNMPGK